MKNLFYTFGICIAFSGACSNDKYGSMISKSHFKNFAKADGFKDIDTFKSVKRRAFQNKKIINFLTFKYLPNEI